MEFELTEFVGSALRAQALDQILACNEFTAPYGLALTEQQALALVEARTQALKTTGRVELGGSAAGKLIRAFCDSPYLARSNFAEIIGELLEVFYDYKNETLDALSDDELIDVMKTAFDSSCQGSVDLLAGRELEALARAVRSGRVQPREKPQFDEEADDGNA